MKLAINHKLITIAIFAAGLAYNTHVYAFGAILEKLNDAIVGGIVGGSNADINSPPLKNRFDQIVDESKLKAANPDKMIAESKSYKLAIVKSVNVDVQIADYKKHVDRRLKGITDYASNPSIFVDEVQSFVPGQKYYEHAVNLISDRFDKVIAVTNVQEGFNQGADYVAVLDLKLENTDLSSKTGPGPITQRNIADLSTVFIDKNYEVGPDIAVKNTSQETYKPIKPDTNIRNSLDIIKRARDKTFNEFEAKLTKLIIKEVDDPPVLGIRLDLSGDGVNVKPKLKNKKKK